MRTEVLKKGKKLDNVVLETSNIVLHRMQEMKEGGRLIVLANGHSMTVKNGTITEVEPFMSAAPVIAGVRDEFVALYTTFCCGGLDVAGLELAEWINENHNQREVILIGHSKSGLMCYNLCKYLSKDICKVKLITTATPYKGTITASPGFKKMDKKFNRLLNLCHRVMWSDHNVDKDICPHSEFLKRLPSEDEVISSVNEIEHINLRSTLVDRALWETQDYQEAFCKFLQWATYGILSDGIVSYYSQNIQEFNKSLYQEDVHCGHVKALEHAWRFI